MGTAHMRLRVVHVVGYLDETAGEVIGSGETVREDWRQHFARQAEEKRTSRKGKGKSEYFMKPAA